MNEVEVGVCILAHLNEKVEIYMEIKVEAKRKSKLAQYGTSIIES